MTDQRIGPPRRWPWLLSNAGILTVTLIVAGIGISALVEMLLLARSAPDTERAEVQIEALKYGLGFFAAAGAVAALLVAVRRQLLAEHSHDLFERNYRLALQAQAHTETDAAERRVTDLYTKAVEQLGSADAAVRLGGLYALERVAQNNPTQRQTVINVFCAYLRMPYTPPAAMTPVPTGPVTELPLPRTEPTASRDPRLELQVRLTAQRILATHLTLPTDVTSEQVSTLTPTAVQPFWYGLDLDLTGAPLINWKLSRAHLRHADFTSATFSGDAVFSEATFTGDARFDKATFTGDARFDKATFTGDARFDKATFTGDARFDKATFTTNARFGQATFTGDAVFNEAAFTGYAVCGEATFCGDARFSKAAFTSTAWFDKATFTGDAWFDKAAFTGHARFDKAAFTGHARFDKATFTGDAWFGQAAFTGDAWFGQATFTGYARFDKVTFIGDVWFDEAPFSGDRLTMADSRVALHEYRQDAWPYGWRIARGPADGWSWLVHETPAMPS
ncbi:pentapeptide repeat-containing protein [Actinoplanes oblitus]|uniref:Pentapeptide repeat-containing protein n=1 Tax=Actinoplanes oblitus TaxID=3040509 RepID=A0ABY8WTL9_9ACTN|nr:pentapeptide repeat-containing protein [Actinoplanes oblitus]WIN00251.1 pentapeptide repeat-containing protein [Actinoplanes oblitus]